ncbi:MAG: hypothetical protein R3F54_23900 [Alphaproteobacteria bacterium]
MLGNIYALGAIGVTLTFGILRFANFAHGEIMTFAVYVTLTLIWITRMASLVLLPLTMAITSVLTSASTASSSSRCAPARRSSW